MTPQDTNGIEGLDDEMLRHAIKCYDDLPAVNKYTWHDNFKTILEAARRYAALNTEQGWIKTTDRLPEKPGHKSYEYVDCLIFHRGEIKQRPWNCEHLCWDDEHYDDHFCDPLEPTHWMPLPSPPKAAGGK